MRCMGIMERLFVGYGEYRHGVLNGFEIEGALWIFSKGIGMLLGGT